MKIVIIGGVAGGASAAARARRLDENAEIVMFERGEYISFANCGLPYHVGGIIKKRDSLLLMTPKGFAERSNVDVRTAQEVIRISPEKHCVLVRRKDTGNTYEESYDKLIMATGSRPKKPQIPGIDDPDVMVIWNMSDMTEVLDRVNDGIKHALILGGGYIGLEMAENFRHRGIKTVLVQRSGQIMSVLDPEMASPLEHCLTANGVKIHFASTISSISREAPDSEKTKAGLLVELSDGSRVRTELVLIAAGIRPNSELASEAGLKIGIDGTVWVNDLLETSEPDIYAVGDLIQVQETVLGAPAHIPLAGPANRQGRIAAENALGAKKRFKGSIGTSICKVFGLTAANAGANEKSLRKSGIEFRKIYINPYSHATYYPGAKQMHLKVIFRPDGQMLGAQIIGTEGVKERIDVLAVAIQMKMSVYDLQELELAYAPPYGSAKEPVNYAGFVAGNLLDGKTNLKYSEDVENAEYLLDVREASEFRAGHIPKSRNIPLGEIRKRIAEIPKDKDVLAYCQVGIRGYLAERILRQNGVRAFNLSGGYVTWKMAATAKII